ncbi:hypothetical protein GLOIN_2v1672635, partial [Rhizophagus irregularis DAOM 181602=DAOM 197198]
IKQHEISSGDLKTYVETKWTTYFVILTKSIHECVFLIVQFKNCLDNIQDNHSEVIITPAILTILYNKGFFSDMQHLSEVLFPIKNAILAVEVTNSTLTDTYVNLMKIAAVIQNLFTDDEYKGFCLKNSIILLTNLHFFFILHIREQN